MHAGTGATGPTIRHWCNRPNDQVAALAAALNPEGNAFRLGDQELVVIHKANIKPKAAIAGQRGAAAGSRQRAETAGAAGAGDSSASDDDRQQQQQQQQPQPQQQTDTITTPKLGNSRMGLSGRSSTIQETVVGPAVKCSCETDIFKAIGLDYVPPHLRNLMQQGGT
uniref:DNA polymerase beta thumb domain-containing protein n=1 Tax=Tetradesmus obliquus TaxID=3088 RepID=A0A383VYZ5_TETOB|eukprot:jgi/Sobl393_1/11924/SZX70099.1